MIKSVSEKRKITTAQTIIKHSASSFSSTYTSNHAEPLNSFKTKVQVKVNI